MSLKKDNLLQISGYFFANVTQAAATFFTIPLLIRCLGIEEFGRWSLVEPFIVVLSQVALLGINQGVLKQISQDKNSPILTVKHLLKASQPAIITTSLLASLIILQNTGFAWQDAILFGILLYTETIVLLLTSSYRAAGCVGAFAASSITNKLFILFILLLSLYVGFFQVQKVEDIIYWRFWATVCCLGLGFFVLRLKYSQHYFVDTSKPTQQQAWPAYIDAVKYGFPLLVAGLLTMVVEFADRYILKAFFEYTILAHYVVYLKIAAILGVFIITPFGIWWPTERFRRLDSEDGGRIFFRTVAITMLVILLLAGGSLWFLSEWLLTWFAPGVPFEPFIILILIYSVIAMGMAYPLNIGLLSQGNTHWNIYGVLLAAIINILLCIFLIPNFGIYGAAWSTVISYLGYMMFLNYFSQRIYPVPFPYGTLISLSLTSLVIIFLIQQQQVITSALLKAILYCVLCLTVFAPFCLPIIKTRKVLQKRI